MSTGRETPVLFSSPSLPSKMLPNSVPIPRLWEYSPPSPFPHIPTYEHKSTFLYAEINPTSVALFKSEHPPGIL